MKHHRKTIAAQFVLLASAFGLACAIAAQDNVTNKPRTNESIEAGKRTYMHYCASCHGVDGRGHGPTAPALKTPPSDLTTLARQHGGQFPYEYVAGVVRFGKPIVAHGSSDMPVWGPIFGTMENGGELAVRRIIRELCDYLATIQEKES